MDGGPGEQARRCLENLTAVCAAAGASLADAVRLTVYLTDMAAFEEVNEVYETYFEADPPARVALAVAGLPRGALVEIDAVVALSRTESPVTAADVSARAGGRARRGQAHARPAVADAVRALRRTRSC